MEEIDKIYKKYCDSHITFPKNTGGLFSIDKLISIIPQQHNKESFTKEYQNNFWFRIKWKYFK